MAEWKPLTIAGQTIEPGETHDVRLKISETYTGDATAIPLRIIRARKPGPTVFVSAAIHGDELNGVGIVHELMFDPTVALHAGTLILMPVVNAFGFESHERYMPDRRDLNRCFPGSPRGSLASRIASTIMEEVVRRCDYGIDLHSAATGRTNFPNVRGDLSDPQVQRLAKAFGCELILSGRGPAGALRREACKAGVPTILLEVGEPMKMEPAMLRIGCTGVINVLIELGMVKGKRHKPPYQTRVEHTRWLRAKVGGIVRFYVVPGQIVEAGQPIACNYSILGKQQNILKSGAGGIVLSLTTLPVVKPGEPVCNLATPKQSIASIRRALGEMDRTNMHHRVRRDMATSISRVPDSA